MAENNDDANAKTEKDEALKKNNSEDNSFSSSSLESDTKTLRKKNK